MTMLSVSVLVVSLVGAATADPIKCSFMGKNGTNDAQILRFGATQACPYTTCGTTVELAKVDTVNNQCRHQFTARVTRSCALAEVYLKFGNETGGSEDSYPHVIEIKKTTSGYRVTLDEEWVLARNLSATNDVIFEDAGSDLRLRIWASASGQGHEVVRITNAEYGNSPCTYTVRYHIQEPTKTEILYDTETPDGGEGECYRKD